MDLEGAKENAKKALEAGANPQDIISRGIAEGKRREHRRHVRPTLSNHARDEGGDRGTEEGGLRDKVKVIVGGAPVTEEYAKEIGADGYGENAIEGVRICKSWMTRQNS